MNHQGDTLLLAWTKASCELPMRVTWQGSVGKPLVTSSQQDMGALVLEQQGAEFCQQPVSLQEDLEPSNTLISAC